MIEDKIIGKYNVHIIASMELETEEPHEPGITEVETEGTEEDPDITEVMRHLIEFSASAYKERTLELMGKSWFWFNYVFFGIYLFLFTWFLVLN